MWPIRLRTSEPERRLRSTWPPAREAGSAPAPAGAELESDTGDALRCAACGRTVAWTEQAIEVQGAHRHDCTNPHGLRFPIACFRHAPGCRELGPATPAWTWFRGYAWRIVVCRGCASHLGWRYEAPGLSGFFGLIVDRLTYSSRTSDPGP